MSFRFATEKDADLLYKWVNDAVARENSYNPAPVDYNTHVDWFSKRIHAENYYFYIFTMDDKYEVGQVRIEKGNRPEEATISITVDENIRGKGHSSQMLRLASLDFLEKNQGFKILAYIFKTNSASYRSFSKAGYELLKEAIVKDIPSYILYKQ